MNDIFIFTATSMSKIFIKVCYVPATSARFPRLLFFDATINSTNEANKPGGSIYLDFYGHNLLGSMVDHTFKSKQK
jgi:hypothetical protein